MREKTREWYRDGESNSNKEREKDGEIDIYVKRKRKRDWDWVRQIVSCQGFESQSVEKST